MESETKQCKVIFPHTLNDHNTLFGGTVMQWMDEVAYITATRFAKKKMVTVSVDHIKFLKPIKPGTIAEIIGKVVKTGNVKIEIQIEIYTEDIQSDQRQKSVTAQFIFAAVDHENKPIPLAKKN